MEETKSKYVVPCVEVDSQKRAYLVHSDYSIENKLLKEPLNNSFNINAFDEKSFCELVNEFKNDTSKLFFTDDIVSCVIDFNTKENGSFRNRVVSLSLVFNPFFKEFFSKLDKNLSQREFIVLLKTLFMFITKIDGKANDNMDVIDIAESLQAVKKIDSVQKNSSLQTSLSVEIKSGSKENITIPSKLTFSLPVYEANNELTGEFETELFVSMINEDEFKIKLCCFTKLNIQREILERIVKGISEKCEGVKAYKANI